MKATLNISIVMLLATLLVVLASCNQKTEGVEIKSTNISIEGEEVSVYIIDSCEYLGKVDQMSHRNWLTHKGNCRFCKGRKVLDIR